MTSSIHGLIFQVLLYNPSKLVKKKEVISWIVRIGTSALDPGRYLMLQVHTIVLYTMGNIRF